MSDTYQPVSCQLHSELELFATRGQTVNIQTVSTDDLISGRIIDITIQDRAEFLVLKTGDGQTSKIRLDLIKSITPA